VSPHWEPLESSDLDRVDAIQRVIHAGLPERRELLAEKRDLFPEGCRRLMRHGGMVGYALAHPWRLEDVPVLNAQLGALPPYPDCLHMHDVAILPEGRGAGAAGDYVRHLVGLARKTGIGALACVSVYGTSSLWARHGFRPLSPDGAVGDARASSALASYGEGAVYMVAEIGRG